MGSHPNGRLILRKKICKYKDKGVYNRECSRTFSNPKVSWGLDNHKSCYFYGYIDYFISTYDQEYKVDLTLYLRNVDAKRHDSVSAFVALSEFGGRYPQLRASAFISDSASDNKATYELLDFWGIDAVIALSKTNDGNYKYPAPLRIDVNGTPVYPSGYNIVYWGDYGGDCPHLMWRCPND